jgi:hypothetical protein
MPTTTTTTKKKKKPTAAATAVWRTRTSFYPLVAS